MQRLIFSGLALGTAVAVCLGIGTAAARAEKPVRWQMASVVPSAVPVFGSLGKNLEQNINLVSGGSFRIKFFEPGALVPPLQVFDSVQKGAIQAGWSSAGYWAGKIPAAEFFQSVPFGPTFQEYLAWMERGGGQKIYDEIYAPHNLKAIPCGTVAPEAGGWFRKEIKTVEDFKGLKMRFSGSGAKVVSKLGVSTLVLGLGDILPALERGTIDAAEIGTPAVDFSVGIYQVAKYYYFPGWHQTAALIELLIHRQSWLALSPQQQAQLKVVCGDLIRRGVAEGEAIQAEALEKLVAKGVEIRRFSPEILAALRKSWDEVVAEGSAKDPEFKRTWESLQSFRKTYKRWGEVGYSGLQ